VGAFLLFPAGPHPREPTRTEKRGKGMRKNPHFLSDPENHSAAAPSRSRAGEGLFKMTRMEPRKTKVIVLVKELVKL
jgi:hypothetical protein